MSIIDSVNKKVEQFIFFCADLFFRKKTKPDVSQPSVRPFYIGKSAFKTIGDTPSRHHLRQMFDTQVRIQQRQNEAYSSLWLWHSANPSETLTDYQRTLANESLKTEGDPIPLTPEMDTEAVKERFVRLKRRKIQLTTDETSDV